MMRLKVLGPVEWWNADAQLPVHGPKLTKVAALLAVRVNQVVTLETIGRELWSDSPPRNATATIRTHIYHLRRLLDEYGERDALRTQAGGYMLSLPSNALDVSAFDRLAAEGRALAADGRHSRAADRFRAALALWRGDPLAGVPAGPVLSGYVALLAEKRTRVLELRIDADIHAGRHDDLIAELRDLVTTDPLNERMHARLIDVLYRAGRRGDALATFRHARNILRDRLGVEPSAELSQLQRQVLGVGAV